MTTIEGIGDLAYTSGSAGMDYYFVDEPVGGSLTLHGDRHGRTPTLRRCTRSDDVEQLFRTFHDRVT